MLDVRLAARRAFTSATSAANVFGKIKLGRASVNLNDRCANRSVSGILFNLSGLDLGQCRRDWVFRARRHILGSTPIRP
jgi:hypothetical protein